MSDVPRSLQSWVSTIHTVVLTADVFQLFIKTILTVVLTADVFKHFIKKCRQNRVGAGQSSKNREVPVGVRPETGGRCRWPITWARIECLLPSYFYQPVSGEEPTGSSRFWPLPFFSDSISTRYQRKPKNTNFFTLNSYQNCRFRSRWNLVETVLKRQEDRCKSRCPIRHPWRDITKTRFYV